MISFAALCSLKDSGREAEWTCDQLSPPNTSCATPQTKLEEQGVRYATTGMGDLSWARQQQRLLGPASRAAMADEDAGGSALEMASSGDGEVPPAAAASTLVVDQPQPQQQQREEEDGKEKADQGGIGVWQAGPSTLAPEGDRPASALGFEEQPRSVQLVDSEGAGGMPEVCQPGSIAVAAVAGGDDPGLILPGLGPTPPGPQGPHQEGAWGPLEFARQVCVTRRGRGGAWVKCLISVSSSSSSLIPPPDPFCMPQARILASRCHVGGTEDGSAAPKAGPCPGDALLPSSSPLMALAAQQVAAQAAAALAKEQVRRGRNGASS
jgi:hypothetical protein